MGGHTQRERLWVYCFKWVAALGHQRGQEFGLLPLWPLTVTAVFLCDSTLLNLFVFYNFVLFYNLFVTSLLGGVEVAVGRTDCTGGGHVSLQTCVLLKLTCLTVTSFTHTIIWCSLLFLFSSTHIYPFFGTSPHLFPSFQSITSPFLFFFPSPGWETGHSCRGTASLSRVALSQPSPKHTATSYPGNCLSF